METTHQLDLFPTDLHLTCIDPATGRSTRRENFAKQQTRRVTASPGTTLPPFASPPPSATYQPALTQVAKEHSVS